MDSYYDRSMSDAERAPHEAGRASAHSYVPRWLDATAAWGWRLVAVALLLYLVLLAFQYLQTAVLPVMLGIILATLLEPIARLLRKLKLPRVLAGALSVVLGLGVLGGLTALLVYEVSGELSQFRRTLGTGYHDLVEWVAQLSGASRGAVRGWVDRHLRELESYAGSIAAQVMSSVVTVLRVVIVLFVTVVFSWFFTWDGDKQFEGLVRILPEPQRGRARELGRRLWHTIGSYMRGMIIIAATDALLLGAGLWLIGLPLVLPLMLLMFLGAWVPFAGPVIAGTVAGLIGLGHGGLSMAGLVILVAFIVQQIEGNLLQPFIMGHAVALHPSVILFAVTAGGVVAGVPGVFLAVPVAASLATALGFVREQGA